MGGGSSSALIQSHGSAGAVTAGRNDAADNEDYGNQGVSALRLAGSK